MHNLDIEEDVRRFLVDVASAPAAVILLGNKSSYQRHTATTSKRGILYPVYAQQAIKQVLLLLQLVALLRRGSPLSNEAINSGICSSTIVSKYLGIQQLKE